MDQDDPLYQDTYEGFITGYSNGADALWELFFGLVYAVFYLPIWMIVQTVKWFRNGRP